jgi:hypothetical protein
MFSGAIVRQDAHDPAIVLAGVTLLYLATRREMSIRAIVGTGRPAALGSPTTLWRKAEPPC